MIVFLEVLFPVFPESITPLAEFTVRVIIREWTNQLVERRRIRNISPLLDSETHIIVEEC